MVEEQELITIPVTHYNSLLEDQDFLNCLKAYGVDNWDGYEYAQKMYREGDDD